MTPFGREAFWKCLGSAEAMGGVPRMGLGSLQGEEETREHAGPVSVSASLCPGRMRREVRHLPAERRVSLLLESVTLRNRLPRASCLPPDLPAFLYLSTKNTGSVKHLAACGGLSCSMVSSGLR